MLEQYLKSVVLPDQSVNPLFSLLGIEVVEIDKDVATLSMAATPQLMQGAGCLAGGVLATLLDEAMAHAVLGGNPATKLTSTVDMNVSYYRPVMKGASLSCTARVKKRGGRVVFAEAVVLDDGLECAAATATFIILDQK